MPLTKVMLNMAGYRQERQFGLILAGIAGIIGLWPMLDGREIAGWWLIVAAGFVVFALVLPISLKPILTVWLAVGHVLGTINTWLLLALAFFLLVTPLALIFRLTGRDILNLRDKPASSYWITREESSFRSFKDQF